MKTYTDYIQNIIEQVKKDLIHTFKDVEVDDADSLKEIY
jgi:hypothetical protein